jgi:hypothetical protein
MTQAYANGRPPRMSGSPGLRSTTPVLHPHAQIGLRALLLVYALGLLSIHLSAPWRLVHEDNGAMQTTLALSHLRYGLAATHAHNVFIDRHTGAAQPYMHHPPAVPLVLAATFALTGDQWPDAARAVMIAFSLGTLAVMLWTLRFLFEDERIVLISGFIMATLPMQAFFGRMVNYESPTLFFCSLQMAAFMKYVASRRRGALYLLAGSIIAGGLFDWASFFFSGAIVIAALIDLRTRGDGAPLLTAALATAAGAFFDLGHIAVASGSLGQFVTVLMKNTGEGHPPLTLSGFVLRQLENFRGYFTNSGLIVAAVTGTARVLRRSRLSDSLFRDADVAVRRFLAIAGGAASVYLVASPIRAQIHHYWQFYFIPFAVISFAVVIRRLLEMRAACRRGAAIALQLMLLEIVLSSSYKLYRRHTRPDDWAIRATRQVEEHDLQPR